MGLNVNGFIPPGFDPSKYGSSDLLNGRYQRDYQAALSNYQRQIAGGDTIDVSGMTMPKIPGYEQSYDPSSMSLVDFMGGKLDDAGYNAFKKEALRRGPSTWAQLSSYDQKLRAADQREKAAGAANAQTAQSMDTLAARGGLSSGARERAATEGSKNYLAMSQDLGRQEGLNTLQIGINDEQNRMANLGQLPGMETQRAGMWADARGRDIANTTTENNRRNQWNMDLFKQRMEAMAAGQTANAQAQAGKK